MSGHGERAHSKFSASGSERWLKCPASVALEEAAPPSIDTFWSKEGTLAHEVLEKVLARQEFDLPFDVSREMLEHVNAVAAKIRAIHKASGGVLLFETRVFASFIHEEMFGTCDAIIAGANGILHIVDFKYGAGHVVDAKENTQLIQYALSAAESYDWDFTHVSMHIMQPRGGGEWHKRWTITIKELKEFWLPLWVSGVARVERGHNKPFPGSHCHWCRAKNFNCSAKMEMRQEKISNVFESNPLPKEKINHGIKEKSKAKETSRQVRGQTARQENEGRQKEKTKSVW